MPFKVTVGTRDRNGCDHCRGGPDNDHYCTPIYINGVLVLNLCDEHLTKIKKGVR